MKRKLTLTIDVKTKEFLKRLAKKRNMTLSKLGEEIIDKLIEKESLKK